MKLIALHRIEHAIEKGALKEGEDGRMKVARWNKTAIIEPGTLFDIDDSEETEIRNLTSGESPAAREPTDRELKMAEVGLIEKAESSPSQITEKTGEDAKKTPAKEDGKKPSSGARRRI